MLTQQTIEEATRRAAAAASSPARIMVFGSYARGDADEGSDLDLVVIECEVQDRAAEYMNIHRAVGALGVEVDVLIFFRRGIRAAQPGSRNPALLGQEGRKSPP